MKKKFLLINIVIVYIVTAVNAFALQSENFLKGKKLFNQSKYKDSKIFFERDIVFNPKNEKSYLYLAKIYDQDKNDTQQEINLNNVLLLNPKNDEAIYLLILLKIKESDYSKTEELIKQFNLVCKTLCSKKKSIEEKFEKLVP